MICKLCNGNGYHEQECTLKYAQAKVDAGPVSLFGQAERFPGHPLLDTRIVMTVAPICITWDKMEELAQELAKVIDKYQI